LYDEFAIRDKRRKKVTLKESKKEYKPATSTVQKNKFSLNQNNFPSFNKGTIKQKEVYGLNKKGGDSKLNNLFSAEDKNKSTAAEKKNTDLIDISPTKTILQPKNDPFGQNKLSQLLDNKLDISVKKVSSKDPFKKGFNKKKLDYDEEFPEL
jgi:hypothetical protein